MNPSLRQLHPYPFEKLRALFAGVTPNPALRQVSLSIGEPKHPTPALVKDTLTANLTALASYPPTAGSDALRQSIAGWIARRYAIPNVDWAKHVLPVNGSREALFAFAQTVIDRTDHPYVICPNPFYQIYEGAAILAGATPYFVNMLAADAFKVNYRAVPDEVWRRTQLLYTCSPANPTGRVMSIAEWQELFELSDQYGFIIASDECYSEIYFDEAAPPVGALQAAQALGRTDFRNVVVFSSLSKRSNCPGMRSGFVAGDADVLAKFLLYRTYHGSAMSPAFQIASIAAWNDEAHVRDNRVQYQRKFHAALPLLAPLGATLPDGGFYFWLQTPIPDPEFARRLLAEQNAVVLPGSYLARPAHGINPGENHVRIALVANHDECMEGVRRIAEFTRTL
ncbi:MAG: succinyldiaminopimelate transaminase [Betaproteobacteria bacterium]|nr:succinyldiaminopimelate transaminase [Betaproteobacteria bacterium]